MSLIVPLLTVCGLVSLLAGSGQTSTTESMAVPSLLVSSAGESVIVSGLPTVALAKALTVSNLVMPCLASSDVGKATFEFPVVKSLTLSCLSDAAVTKFGTWPDLVVTALAKSLAVPAAIESVTLSSFVLTTDTFAAEVALWRYARDLGIPLGLHLPLPGEALEGTCPMGPGPGRLDEL